ncbi:MAG: hypothetical protein H6867_11445 [Rhodospirillales bacterium]|nr:hypothetical protein [Rhodospirillales bacterium]MCB9996744.1 hypothetical protein [Rhodospirillales bacterium]
MFKNFNALSDSDLLETFETLGAEIEDRLENGAKVDDMAIKKRVVAIHKVNSLIISRAAAEGLEAHNDLRPYFEKSAQGLSQSDDPEDRLALELVQKVLDGKKVNPELFGI